MGELRLRAGQQSAVLHGLLRRPRRQLLASAEIRKRARRGGRARRREDDARIGPGAVPDPRRSQTAGPIYAGIRRNRECGRRAPARALRRGRRDLERRCTIGSGELESAGVIHRGQRPQHERHHGSSAGRDAGAGERQSRARPHPDGWAVLQDVREREPALQHAGADLPA